MPAAARRRPRRPASARRRRSPTPVTHDEVFSLVQAHLCDELDLDPERIESGTRFKEDLEADSLDLYTLVQELEDTYGVAISDEQAARILTVGQAVDFVLSHAAAS
jgi:acyl carrier protein